MTKNHLANTEPRKQNHHVRSTRFPLVCLAILIIHAPRHAQTRSYHVESTENVPPLAPRKRVILVNDSDKPIEAFHLSAQCGVEGTRGFYNTESTYDALDYWGSEIGYPGPDGRIIPKSAVIAPRSQMLALPTLNQQPSGCVWKADIDAVIYADGSYEGDEKSARGLQARRDGIATSVRLWSGRMNQQSADTPPPTIVGEAMLASQRDSSNTMLNPCRSAPLACQYWQGRRLVDSNILGLQRLAQDSPADRYSRPTSEIERWQKKIDSNLALKKLEETFPLPHEITDQTAQSQASTPKQ